LTLAYTKTKIKLNKYNKIQLAKDGLDFLKRTININLINLISDSHNLKLDKNISDLLNNDTKTKSIKL